MTKKKLIVMSIIFIAVILFIEIIRTYALFETNKEISVSSNIAKWNIKVNNTMVTNSNNENTTFSLGSIDWNSGGHVREGKAAPGSTGTFEIEIDPTNTQVSFVYELTIDTSNLNNKEFVISNVNETNNNYFIRTGENTYIGIARLSDNQEGQKYNIEINITWNNNEENNEKDYELGKKAELEINIPVSLKVSQYVGTEQFTEYQEQDLGD